jgi:predicted permease
MIRIKAATESWIDVLNKYALWLGFPALIFSALAKIDFGLGEYTTLIAANSIYLVACVLLAFPVSIIFKTSLKTKRTLFLILAFGNISYLGIPVLVSAYGNEVLGAAVLISAVYLFWMFTLALVLIEITGHEKVHYGRLLKKLAMNPLLVAVILGITASYLKIKLDSTLMKTVDLFGNSVTAIVLFSIGLFLGSQELGSKKDWLPVLLLSLAIMVVIPGIYFFILRGIHLTKLQFQASILEAAMPLGLTPYALAEQYKLNAILAGRLVVFSTILSVIILPAWMVFAA